MRFEHPLEMALVGEAQPVSHFGQGKPLAEQMPAMVDPGIDEIGMRRQPGCGAERPDQLVTAKACLAGQCFKAQLCRVLRFDMLDQAFQGWQGQLRRWSRRQRRVGGKILIPHEGDQRGFLLADARGRKTAGHSARKTRDTTPVPG